MSALKKWIPRALVAFLLVMSVTSIARSLAAGPADAPTKKDLAGVSRTAVPLQHDVLEYRMPIPPAGVVAAAGIVEPADREIAVGANEPGLISQILVKENQQVTRGTPLIVLEDGVQQARAAAAQAEVERARAELAQVKSGSRPEQNRSLEAQAKAAEARSALSQLTLKRTEALHARRAASTEQLDQARYQAQIDAADAQSRRALADASQRGWKQDIAVATAALAQAEAQLQQAQADLADRTVKAPIDGTVLQLIVRAGEYYNPAAGTPLARMGDLRTIRARLDVDELDIAKVKLGQRGYVTAPAFGDKKFSGTVVEVAARMGRKNVRSDEPTERIDTKIREVVLQLDDGSPLVQGLRVYGYLQTSAPNPG